MMSPPTKGYYTGVGSRSTPVEICRLITRLATKLYDKGYMLRSGGAEGADKAFEDGAHGFCKIYLPWRSFNNNPSPYYSASEEAFTIASKVHPAWDNLKQGAKKCHARNVHQVLGDKLGHPSKFLVCWTPNAQLVGGTRTAIKIAQKHGVPVYNLADTNTLEKIQRYFHV